MQSASALKFILKEKVIVVGQAHAAEDDLIDIGTQSHHAHHLVVWLVRVSEERNLLA